MLFSLLDSVINNTVVSKELLLHIAFINNAMFLYKNSKNVET